MSDYDELIHISATVETQRLAAENVKKKTAVDYFALGVGEFYRVCINETHDYDLIGEVI